MTDVLGGWIKSQQGGEKAMFTEAFVIDVGYQILSTMSRLYISRSELAKRLGISKSKLSAMLCGDPDLTIRQLAEIAYFLNCTIDIRFRERHDQSKEIND